MPLILWFLKPLRDVRTIALCAALASWLSGVAQAQMTEVDLELVLLVDVSRSMSEAELELQRRGYAEALSSDEVFKAVQSGLLQNVALTYVEWAGSQQIVVDWRIIQTKADLNDFARQLTVKFDPALRRTSISNALAFATDHFDTNQVRGLRRVIDISGDGPNNQGRAVLLARSEVLGRGIIINGLPLMTQDALSLRWGIPDLDVYYAECVIGGPGSFMIPVLRWEEFEPAIKRKLILEIADSAPRASITRASGYDCLVGEKIWRRNMEYWYEP